LAQAFPKQLVIHQPSLHILLPLHGSAGVCQILKPPTTMTMPRVMMPLFMLMLVWQGTGVRVVRESHSQALSAHRRPTTEQLQQGSSSPSGHEPDLHSKARPLLLSASTSVFDSQAVTGDDAPTETLKKSGVTNSSSSLVAEVTSWTTSAFTSSSLIVGSRQSLINLGLISSDPALCPIQNSEQLGCKRTCRCDWYQQCFPKYDAGGGDDIGVCNYSIQWQVAAGVSIFISMLFVTSLLRACFLAASEDGKYYGFRMASQGNQPSQGAATIAD